MTKKCISSKILLVLCIFLIVLPVTACEGDLNGEPAVIEEEKPINNGEDEEKMTSEQSFPKLTMPPIDKEVPENLETATLALG